MADIKTILSSDRVRLAFARRAASYLNAHRKARSYSDGDPQPGELFALRWAPPPKASDGTEAAVISLLVFELPYDAVVVGDLDDGETPIFEEKS